MRKPVNAEEQLAITLRFFRTGESYHSLMTQYGVAESTIGSIVPRVSWALVRVLWKDHMQFPWTTDEWDAIAENYSEKWNFPHCLGAIDRKHISIVCPKNSVSEYHIKKTSSALSY